VGASVELVGRIGEMSKQAKRNMDLSDEERERRSKLAKDLAKKGKFGGNQKGSGRPKKERAQKHVAEKIKEDGEKIYRALMAALSSDSPSVKLKAALALLEIETKETELQIKEEQRLYENMDRDKLLELIQKRMEQLEKENGINVSEIIVGTARESGRERVKESVTTDGRALPPGSE